jgi:hypothetical protein
MSKAVLISRSGIATALPNKYARVKSQGPLKRWLSSTRLHGATTQKTVIFVLTAVRTSSPTNRSLFNRPLNCTLSTISGVPQSFKTTCTFRYRLTVHRVLSEDILLKDHGRLLKMLSKQSHIRSAQLFFKLICWFVFHTNYSLKIKLSFSLYGNYFLSHGVIQCDVNIRTPHKTHCRNAGWEPLDKIISFWVVESKGRLYLEYVLWDTRPVVIVQCGHR